MKVGDKIKNKRSDVILQIVKVGNPTLTCKVVDIGDGSVPGLRVGKIEKTSTKLIGVTYDLIEETKMKLTIEQKAKVIKFAKTLVNKKVIKEDDRPTQSIGGMLKKGFNFQSLNPKDIVNYRAKNYEVTHVGNDHCFIKFGPVVKKITNIRDISPVKVKALEESKVINENNTYTMISALREIVDDLLLSTELLIDNNYGKLEHKEFKDAWYKSSNEFEKKFRNIIKNLMKAGK